MPLSRQEASVRRIRSAWATKAAELEAALRRARVQVARSENRFDIYASAGASSATLDALRAEMIEATKSAETLTRALAEARIKAS